MISHATAEFCERCKLIAALIVAAFKIMYLAGNENKKMNVDNFERSLNADRRRYREIRRLTDSPGLYAASER